MVLSQHSQLHLERFTMKRLGLVEGAPCPSDSEVAEGRGEDGMRERYVETLRVEDLARQANMSVSGFHAHFKAATAMTPLQFLKEIRLQEARRLLLSEEAGAAEAGFRVGYDDASHFSRDYKRHFGAPPLRDVQQLRQGAAGSA